MKIISDFSKDIQTVKPLPGSYEWWYFDAVSADGYCIVVIFYEGNPFSKRYIEAIQKNDSKKASAFPALSISLYHKGKPIFYSFDEVLPEFSSFSASQPKGSVGACSFFGEKIDQQITYAIRLNQKLPSGDSLKGELIFQSDVFEDKNFDIADESPSENSRHTWNLVQPKAGVHGRLELKGHENKEIVFSGVGYHDHNLGFEPMKDSFDEWYWGRYHFKESTLIYYIMHEKGTWDKRAWLIDSAGTVSEAKRILLKEEGLSFFGLKSARVIELEGDGFKIHLQKDVMVDNGPFYQRFSGRAILKGEKGIDQARGISEYIYPARIYQKLFWPLVDMRINYPGKEHWVQKSPVFYRWTW
jgi:carotenoid 1,2-hydratase